MTALGSDVREHPGARWWRDRWARHLVASLERRLQREACGHDGVSTCPVCRLVTSVGFLPAAAPQVEDSDVGVADDCGPSRP